MPLRNRVEPTGEIVAVSARGTMMGNRGRLHDEQRRLVRTRQVDRWLCCVLEFRGRHRVVMTPNRYTELFFLDEVSALAAGHRPCGECRYPDYQRFRRAWHAAGLPAEQVTRDGLPSADAMDARLAVDRRTRVRLGPGELPDGALVLAGAGPHLCWSGRLWEWSWAGYREAGPATGAGLCEVLTPEATLAVLAHGYRPTVHPSLDLDG
jgi:hypothetical protein